MQPAICQLLNNPTILPTSSQAAERCRVNTRRWPARCPQHGTRACRSWPAGAGQHSLNAQPSCRGMSQDRHKTGNAAWWRSRAVARSSGTFTQPQRLIAAPGPWAARTVQQAPHHDKRALLPARVRDVQAAVGDARALVENDVEVERARAKALAALRPPEAPLPPPRPRRSVGPVPAYHHLWRKPPCHVWHQVSCNC